MLKFVLILWLSGNHQGLPSPKGDILDLYYPDRASCTVALSSIKKKTEGRIDGMCLKWGG